MRTVESIESRLSRGLAQAIEVGDCLEWQGYFSCKGVTPCVKAKDPNKDPKTRRSDNFSVPRLLWEREHGPVPAGKLIFRCCCNNACVLQGHLRCGTRADWAKARKRAGVTKHSPDALIRLTLGARRRHTAINSIDKARQVRSLAAEGLKDPQVARETGVSEWMVAEIRRGDAWRELSASPFAGLAA